MILELGPIETGDNLDLLSRIPDNCINLIYLDPPFNSGVDYNNVVPNSKAHELAHEETWKWGTAAEERFRYLDNTVYPSYRRVIPFLKALIDIFGTTPINSYLTFIAPRLVHCHRILSPTGTVWLHCDPYAVDYLKILMDSIFGQSNYKNHFIWSRTSSTHNNAKRAPNSHDFLLVYSKSDKYTWNKIFMGDNKTPKKSKKLLKDVYGSYSWQDVTGKGKTKKGESGQVWNDVDPNKVGIKGGRHWQISGELSEPYKFFAGEELKGSPLQKLNKLYSVDLVKIWYDIPPVKTNFAGEKPEELIKRIMDITTPDEPGENYVILDPFLGSGTTAIVAEKMKRKWIGCELTHASALPAVERLNKTFGVGNWGAKTECGYNLPQKMPADYAAAEDLIEKDPHLAELVLVQYFKGKKETKETAIDGIHLINGFADNISRVAKSEVQKTLTLDKVASRTSRVYAKDKTISLIFFIYYYGYTKSIQNWCDRQGTFTSGIEGDDRVFPRVQLVSVKSIYDRLGRYGSLRIPGDFVYDPRDETERVERDKDAKYLDDCLEEVEKLSLDFDPNKDSTSNIDSQTKHALAVEAEGGK